MTAITTIWKKSRAAVFYLISGILVAVAWSAHYFTPQGSGSHTERGLERARRKAERAGRKDEDAKTIAWLARLRERRVPPLAVGRVQVAAISHALRQQAMNADLAPSHADLDQYLTEDAKRYPAAFDAAHRILDGEIAPPWIGPQVGDITLDAPMTYRPEPPLEPLPPARAIPDVPPVAILHIPDLPPDKLEQLKQRFLAAVASGEPPTVLTDDPADELRQEDCCPACPPFIGDPGHCPEHHYGPGPMPDCPARTNQDVPGPAETASPPPPSGNGAEAALPPAVASAGPGTTRPDVDDLDNTGVMAALTDWALHAPLDQVRAVAHG